MEKNHKGLERRKYRRVVFSAKDAVTGAFSFSGLPDKLVSYKIADLSAGGLRFILPRDDERSIRMGDVIFLHNIKGDTTLEFAGNIQLEVKWTMDHEQFQHIMIGCEFVHLTADSQKQMEDFLEAEQKA